MQKRRFPELKPAGTPSLSRTDEDRERFHHLHNNFAAIRLWLTMLRQSSCARCRRLQADGLRAIERNLEEAQASIAERFRVRAPAVRRSRGGTRKAAR